MNTNTKEEILDKVFKRDCGWTFDELIQTESHANLKQSSALIGYSISDAMEQYAQQEAIGFAEWIDKFQIIRCDTPKGYYSQNMDSLFCETIQQLYQQYQQSKNKL